MVRNKSRVLNLIFLATAALLINEAAASTRQKTLLDVSDKLFLMNGADGSVYDQVELRQFPYIMSYSKNVTVNGDLCYSLDLQTFLKDCYEKQPKDTSWIVVSPFDYVNTNDLLSSAPDYNIEGVIIQYDQAIEAAGYYAKPQLIAIASNADGKDLAQLAQPNGVDTKCKMEHRYLTNCSIVTSMQGYYAVISCIYLIICLLWIQQTWSQYAHVSDGASLQKSLTAIPVLKLFQVTIYTAYTGSCPWENQIQARYLLMALVTLSTIYQTIFISILLLLSKGWSIARSSLARQDLSTITLMMGAIYLVYSAFYVSINIEGMKLFISVVLNALYLVLMIVVLKNSHETRSLLKAQQTCIHENEIDQLRRSVDLKVSIMTKFIVIAVFYFGFELVINGLIPSVELAARQSTHQSTQSTYNPWEEVIQQYYDLAIISCILWVFRARKWPEYFTVGLLDGEQSDFNQTINQIIEQYKVVPFFSTTIDNKLLHSSKGFDVEDNDEYGLNRSFRSEEQVLVLNPCDYSRLSEDSAQEATLVGYENPDFEPGSVDREGRARTGEKRVGDKKSKLFSNIFIAKKIGSQAHNKVN